MDMANTATPMDDIRKLVGLLRAFRYRERVRGLAFCGALDSGVLVDRMPVVGTQPEALLWEGVHGDHSRLVAGVVPMAEVESNRQSQGERISHDVATTHDLDHGEHGGLFFSAYVVDAGVTTYQRVDLNFQVDENGLEGRVTCFDSQGRGELRTLKQIDLDGGSDKVSQLALDADHVLGRLWDADGCRGVNVTAGVEWFSGLGAAYGWGAVTQAMLRCMSRRRSPGRIDPRLLAGGEPLVLGF